MGGTVEKPGLFRVIQDVWQPSRKGEVYFSAEEDGAEGGGDIEVDLEDNCVVQRLPTGQIYRWCIRDWGFDPFSPQKPAADTENPENAEDVEATSKEEEGAEDIKEAAPAQETKVKKKLKKEKKDKKEKKA